MSWVWRKKKKQQQGNPTAARLRKGKQHSKNHRDRHRPQLGQLNYKTELPLTQKLKFFTLEIEVCLSVCAKDQEDGQNSLVEGIIRGKKIPKWKSCWCKRQRIASSQAQTSVLGEPNLSQRLLK